MINQVLPAKYAGALFEIADKAGVIKEVRDELVFIKEALAGDKKFRAVLNHPGISRKEKKEVIEDVFGDKVSAVTLNFLRFLIDKKREGLLGPVCGIFSEKADEHLGIKKIIIETAYRLDDREKEKIVKKLEIASQKKIKVDARVNAGILGGIIIRDRMKLIDASVVQFLNALKKDLRAVKAVKPKKKKGKKKKKAVKKKRAVKKKAVKKKKKQVPKKKSVPAKKKKKPAKKKTKKRQPKKK